MKREPSIGTRRRAPPAPVGRRRAPSALLVAPAAFVVATAVLLLASVGSDRASSSLVEGFASPAPRGGRPRASAHGNAVRGGGGRSHGGGGTLTMWSHRQGEGTHREEARENYFLRAADEAYRKYYAGRPPDGGGEGSTGGAEEGAKGAMSKEEYLTLAVEAWSKGAAARGTSAGDGRATKNDGGPYFASSRGTNGDATGGSEEINGDASKRSDGSVNGNDGEEGTAEGNNPLDFVAKWVGDVFSRGASPSSMESSMPSGAVEENGGDDESVPYGLRVGTANAVPPPPRKSDSASSESKGGNVEGTATTKGGGPNGEVPSVVGKGTIDGQQKAEKRPVEPVKEPSLGKGSIGDRGAEREKAGPAEGAEKGPAEPAALSDDASAGGKGAEKRPMEPASKGDVGSTAVGKGAEQRTLTPAIGFGTATSSPKLSRKGTKGVFPFKTSFKSPSSRGSDGKEDVLSFKTSFKSSSKAAGSMASEDEGTSEGLAKGSSSSSKLLPKGVLKGASASVGGAKSLDLAKGGAKLVGSKVGAPKKKGFAFGKATAKAGGPVFGKGASFAKQSAGGQAGAATASKAPRKGMTTPNGERKASNAAQRPVFPLPFKTPPKRTVGGKESSFPPASKTPLQGASSGEAEATIAKGLQSLGAALKGKLTNEGGTGGRTEGRADPEDGAKDDARWLEEQNALVRERLEQRRAEEKARSVRVRSEEPPPEGRADAEEARAKVEEEARWIEEQNALVQKRLEQRRADEKAKSVRVRSGEQLPEEVDAEETRAKAEEEARWLEEQNALVQKRLERRRADEKARSVRVRSEEQLPEEKTMDAEEIRAKAAEEARWLEEQNALVQKRLEQRRADEKARSVRVRREEQLPEEKTMDAEEIRAKAVEEARWLEEQNALVQKRLEMRRVEEEAIASAASEMPDPPLKGSARGEESAKSSARFSSLKTKQSTIGAPPSVKRQPGGSGGLPSKTPFLAELKQSSKTNPTSSIGAAAVASPEAVPLSTGLVGAGEGPGSQQVSLKTPEMPQMPPSPNSVPVQTTDPMSSATNASPATLGATAAPIIDSPREKSSNDLAASQVSDEGMLVLDDVDQPWLAPLAGMDEPPLPLLHVGNRIRSSVHGTTHEGYLVISADEGNGMAGGLRGNRYNVMPCIAKRPWSVSELNATVPSQVLAFERQQYDAIDEEPAPESWELEAKATAIRRYYEVEIHTFQKVEKKRELLERLRMQKQQDEKEGRAPKENNDVPANSVADIAVPKFLKVYPDDGSGGPRIDDAIPEYGATGLDVWGKALGVGHEWLVYEGGVDTELTLLDAMENDSQIGSRHRLYGIQRALNLPETHAFGDVLDVIFRSLLENLVFLSSCNIVHRDLRPSNIVCDGKNQRLGIANFGNAVDLDPPRVGLDNDSLQLDAPGSIANTLAADIFSAALVVCQLAFGFADTTVLNRQLKDASYDLDAWLRAELMAEPRPVGFDEGLSYLAERKGLWSLLKSAIRPNPLRKRITADSLRQFNEVLGLKSGEITLTSELKDKIDREEAYLRYVLDSPPGSAITSTGVPSTKTTDAGMTKATEDMRGERGAPSVSDEAFDITQVPFTLHPEIPTPSELRRKAEQLSLTPKVSTVTTALQGTSSDGAFDVTRLQFRPPARKSLLANMMDSHAKRRAEAMVQQQQKMAFARTHFQRASPQLQEVKAIALPGVGSRDTKLTVVDVLAPPGSLGVVVNTDNFGSVYVSSISENSPLLGEIYLGDVVVAVDDIDVTQFVAEEVVRILLSLEEFKRTITVLREVDDAVEPTGAGVEAEAEGLMQTDLEKPEQAVPKKSISLATTAPALEDEDEPCYKEVEKWLRSVLPALREQDAEKYCQCLIDDGFDSVETLDELLEEDLHFMKVGHKRALLRKLSLAGGDSPALPPSPGQQLAVKKVYKVDEALGEAARKGIEAIIAEEKRRAALAKSEAQTSRREMTRVGAEEEVGMRALDEERRRPQQPLKSREDEEMSLDNTNKQNSSVTKNESAKEERETEEEDRFAARQSELKKLADEARQLEEDQVWLAEQNEMVKKRHTERIAREKQLLREEESDAALQREFEEEAERLEETKAWIAEQNELVEKRHRARIAKERQLREEAEREADQLKQLREAEAWMQEQNELVEKRYLSRIAEERELSAGTGRMGVDSDVSRADSVSPVAPKSSAKDAASAEQIRQGMTAEEAEMVREARLKETNPSGPASASQSSEHSVASGINGAVSETPSAKSNQIRQGMTADEAERVRKSRLSEEASQTGPGESKPPDPKAG